MKKNVGFVLLTTKASKKTYTCVLGLGRLGSVSPLLERLNAHSGPICHVIAARGAIGVLYCHSLWQQPTGQQAGRYRVA